MRPMQNLKIKAPPAEAESKVHGACCNAREGELGKETPGPKARGKGRGVNGTAAGSSVDVAALDWDAWLALKALQRAAWRARGG